MPKDTKTVQKAMVLVQENAEENQDQKHTSGRVLIAARKLGAEISYGVFAR